MNPRLVAVRPMDGDPSTQLLSDGGPRAYLTMLALQPCRLGSEGDYAYGSVEAARVAWALAENMGMSVEEAAAQVLVFAAKKNGAVA